MALTRRAGLRAAWAGRWAADRLGAGRPRARSRNTSGCGGGRRGDTAGRRDAAASGHAGRAGDARRCRRAGAGPRDRATAAGAAEPADAPAAGGRRRPRPAGVAAGASRAGRDASSRRRSLPLPAHPGRPTPRPPRLRRAATAASAPASRTAAGSGHAQPRADARHAAHGRPPPRPARWHRARSRPGDDGLDPAPPRPAGLIRRSCWRRSSRRPAPAGAYLVPALARRRDGQRPQAGSTAARARRPARRPDTADPGRRRSAPPARPVTGRFGAPGRRADRLGRPHVGEGRCPAGRHAGVRVRRAGRSTQTTPSCQLNWTTLAAIGKVESNHGRANGALAAGRRPGAAADRRRCRWTARAAGSRSATPTAARSTATPPGTARSARCSSSRHVERQTRSTPTTTGRATRNDIDDAALAAGTTCAGRPGPVHRRLVGRHPVLQRRAAVRPGRSSTRPTTTARRSRT